MQKGRAVQSVLQKKEGFELTRKYYLVLFIVLILTASLMVTGCGGSSDTTTPTDDSAPTGDEPSKVLKVGVLGPFTGPNSRVGEEFQGAVEMAMENYNYTIGDYKLEIVQIDSQSDPEKATRALEDAHIRDNIDVSILNWHSSVAVACMDVAARNQVPHFFGFGATDVVNEKYLGDPELYSYWIGKTWPTPGKLVKAYVDTIEEAIDKGLWVPRNKKAAMICEDTDWGRSIAAAMIGYLEAEGWEIVAEEYFVLGETEHTPALLSIRNTDASLIGSSVGSAPSFAALVKQSREVNLQAVMMCDGLGWVGEWYELTGDASNYILDQIPQWTTEESLQFLQDFETRYGFTPSTSAGGLAYDATSFFLQIAQACYDEYGELSRETLHAFANEKVLTGQIAYTDGIIMEKYVFSPDSIPDPVVGEGFFIFPVIQYFEGKGTVVWPDSFKTGDFIAPDYLQ